MSNIFSFQGNIPYIHESSYIHPQATVIGSVNIGKYVYVGPQAVLRGDWGQIEVKDGCNIQETCVLHMFPQKIIILEKNSHIGHGAIIHGAHIGENCLIGMNAVLMDDVIIEKESIVGALSFIAAKTHIPERSLVVGNPAKIIKKVTDEMLAWKSEGTKLYRSLPDENRSSLKEVAPLREKPLSRKIFQYDFKPWEKT